MGAAARAARWVADGRALAAGLALAAAPGAAQDAADGPAPLDSSFSAEASAITVDVVVLDGAGNPVTGLAPEDFRVFEDGRPQAIVGFEAVAAVSRREAPPPLPGGATNVGAAGETGRVMALLIDDLGIAPHVMGELRPALAGWIRERAADRDEITIVTTSGDRWWSDVAARGRDDLVATLESVTGKRLEESGTAGWISEAEAYDIQVAHFNLEKQLPNDQRSRPDFVPGGYSALEGELQSGASGMNATLERVAARYLDAGLCDRMEEPRTCFGRVQAEAARVSEVWRGRAETTFRAVQQLSRSLASAPGRKSILLVSETFIDDRTIDGPFRATVDAAQRANAAVYFVSAGGLLGSPTFSAANGGAARREDVAALAREEGTLRLLGGRNLAEATGGALTASNDLAAGLERMARESSSYYLLGYQPERAPDGRWHDLKVEVGRGGVSVHARRSYRAARPGDAMPGDAETRTAGAKGGDRAPGRALAPALRAGSVRAGLPLRLGAYVGRPAGEGAVVQLVVEVDNSRVQVDRSRTPWRALVDVTVMAARVGGSPLVPVDERLDLSLEPGDVDNGWWMISREALLSPGRWQIRAWVSDLGSLSSGLVTTLVEVPDVDRTYLSTLMLTDRTVPSTRPGTPPRVVPTALRRFGSRGDVVCQYEVFNYGGRGIAGLPKLTAGYTLHREGDPRPTVVEHTPIEKAAARAVRRIVLPLERLPDGRYTITVSVQDALVRRRLVARESFVVERAARTGGSGE